MLHCVAFGQIRINGENLFDYASAKELFNQILIPYYKMLGFPVKMNESGIEEPFNFCLEDFNTGLISEKNAEEMRKYYLAKGFMLDDIEYLVEHPESGLTPSEVGLLNQYKNEISHGHLKK